MEEIFCRECNTLVENGELLRVVVTRIKVDEKSIDCAEMEFYYCNKCAIEGILVKLNEVKG